MTQEQNQTSPSALERRIDMIVASADIEREVEQRLKQLSRTVKMAGFRPGKVPFKLVAQQYGPQARSEAIGAAVEKTFGEKVREQNLKVAGYPRFEPKSAETSADLEFSAVFEVFPDIVLADLKDAAIEKVSLAVGDAEVDKTIDVLRKQRTTYVPAGRAAAKDDRVVIDFTGTIDGVEFEGGKAEDFTVQVGAGQMLPDFDAALEGVAEGQSKSFDVAFPADYHAPNLAGKTARFDIVVKRVDAPQLPELTAEFARSLGVADGDLEKMRAEIRTNLEREVKKRVHARTKNQVMDALLAAHPIDVPKALVDMEAHYMVEAAREDFKNRGMPTDMPINPSWFGEQATRRVKLGLILAEVVKANDLKAKPEHVRAVVDDFAATFEEPQEVVRWYYSQPQRLQEAESLATENNVVEWALSVAKVTEKAVAFDELMGNAA